MYTHFSKRAPIFLFLSKSVCPHNGKKCDGVSRCVHLRRLVGSRDVIRALHLSVNLNRPIYDRRGNHYVDSQILTRLVGRRWEKVLKGRPTSLVSGVTTSSTTSKEERVSGLLTLVYVSSATQ